MEKIISKRKLDEKLSRLRGEYHIEDIRGIISDIAEDGFVQVETEIECAAGLSVGDCVRLYSEFLRQQLLGKLSPYIRIYYADGVLRAELDVYGGKHNG